MPKARRYTLIPGDWTHLETIINELGYRVLDSDISLSDLAVDGGLVANRLVQTDSDVELVSVSDFTNWIDGTANQIEVSDDGDGTITLAITDPIDIPGKATAGSFSSPLDVTAAREYGFEIHYSGNNYNVTGIRSRASLITTDTTAQCQGGLFQAANTDGIDVGVLNGLLAEAIGKSDTTAAAISTMRGALIGAEWEAFDTVTDLKTLHIRTHTRNNAGAGSFDTGYGLFIENEAVGGNGQALDAGIYFKDTNLSGGNTAFDYGIDFSGGTFLTAEIMLSNGETIDNLTDGEIEFSGEIIATGLTTPGTVEAEQLTSTDDLRVQGHLIAFGSGEPVDTVIHFVGASYDGYLTYDESDDIFDFGDSKIKGTLYAGSGGTSVIYAYASSFVIQRNGASHTVLRIASGVGGDSGDWAGFYLTNDADNPHTSANSAFGMLAKSDHTELVQFIADANGNQIVFTNLANRLNNHDHSTQTNPTLFIHSDTDPNSDNTQWLSITHNQTDGIITTGKGTLNLGSADGKVNFSTATRVGSTVTHDGYVELEIGGVAYKFMLGS